MRLQRVVGNQWVGRLLQRITYAEARAGLKSPHIDVLDRWLLYKAAAGPASLNETAEAVLTPLSLAGLEGRLEYWLDTHEEHPSGRPKEEVLGATAGPWEAVLDKATHLAMAKVEKKLGNQNDPANPKKTLDARTKGKNFEITSRNARQLADEVFDSIKAHYLVTTKDVEGYLAGRDKRQFPPQLASTAKALLDQRVLDRVRKEVDDVTGALFTGEREKLLPHLTGDGLLANADRAVIDDRKLSEYVLNPAHPVGGNKAKLFVAILGMETRDADVLKAALLKAVVSERPVLETGRATQHGQSFTVRFTINGVGAKAANVGMVESGWIYKTGQVFPTLTTCYLEGGGKDWRPGVTYLAIFADGTLVTEADHPARLEQPTWDYVQSQLERPRVETRRTVQTNRLYQERHYDKDGYPVKDVDYTSPTRPDGSPFTDHAPPGHEHEWVMKVSGDPSKGWLRQGGEG